MGEPFPRVTRILVDADGNQIGESMDCWSFFGAGLFLMPADAHASEPDSIFRFPRESEAYFFKRFKVCACPLCSSEPEQIEFVDGYEPGSQRRLTQSVAGCDAMRFVKYRHEGGFQPAFAIPTSCLELKKCILFPIQTQKPCEGNRKKQRLNKDDISAILIVFHQPGELAWHVASPFRDNVARRCLPIRKIVAPIIDTVIGPWERRTSSSSIPSVLETVASALDRELEYFMLETDGSLHNTTLSFQGHRPVPRKAPGLLLQYELEPAKSMPFPGEGHLYPLTRPGVGMPVEGGKAVYSAVQFGTREGGPQLTESYMKELKKRFSTDPNLVANFGCLFAAIDDRREFPSSLETGDKIKKCTRVSCERGRKLHGNDYCIHQVAEVSQHLTILFDLRNKAASDFFFSEFAKSLGLVGGILYEDLADPNTYSKKWKERLRGRARRAVRSLDEQELVKEYDRKRKRPPANRPAGDPGALGSSVPKEPQACDVRDTLNSPDVLLRGESGVVPQEEEPSRMEGGPSPSLSERSRTDRMDIYNAGGVDWQGEEELLISLQFL